ncbi:Protein of unknown function (DUF3143) [Xenococcus sp. PCC 7305]|uniref:DUF3143 domain-containing protein n=1 Tax=Xenococcus sp. PCC 7305 TaxID=102125 RepID=UPI0002ACA949|nr:DUF3143 domain-containing protein [Xenococcus sp. PCC 7305]ELS02516.1 Protein of unknown function (DUF3143) [Xenococcus sp. PCC 7305]
MELPTGDTPLYNHPLPKIEKWLVNLGCQQNEKDLHCWYIEKPTWKAEICLEIEELTVNYLAATSGEDLMRSFKYSLSRQDVEAAVFSGP